MKSKTKLTKDIKSEEPVIISYGQISSIKWPGAVSAEKILNDKNLTFNDIFKNGEAELNTYYVKANNKAKTRCIDGRHDPELEESMLGSQVPGGAPGAAIAYRIGVDKDDLTRGSFLSDAESMISIFSRLGLGVGGHRDENSQDNSINVGCGAIDGMDRILATMTDTSLVEDHKRLVRELLGEEFVRDDYLRNLGASTMVNGRSDEYFKDRSNVIKKLEEEFPGSVSVLSGHHEECFVFINFVPDTTFSSNRFFKDKNVQAFGYDIWRSKQIAEMILPRPEQQKDRIRFVHGRVMFTIATLMALTDGSQKLYARLPGENSSTSIIS